MYNTKKWKTKVKLGRSKGNLCVVNKKNYGELLLLESIEKSSTVLPQS